MVTAADRLDEKVAGFELGADDYLTKPFELQELVMRLHALRRRPAESTPPVLEMHGLRLDPFRREVYRDGRYVALTRKQFSVLQVLMEAQGGVVSAESLLERAWDENADPFSNAVRITISSLRKRLRDPWLVHTVAGVGYRIGDPTAAPDATNSTSRMPRPQHPRGDRPDERPLAPDPQLCRVPPHCRGRDARRRLLHPPLRPGGQHHVRLGLRAEPGRPRRRPVAARLAGACRPLAVVGLAGGWLLAGSMLRPLQRIHDVAVKVAAGSLDQRVGLSRRSDELGQLAETFDSMLERLEHAFDEQRRFAANASHELRTPYAISRSILDLARAAPEQVDMAEVIARLDATKSPWQRGGRGAARARVTRPHRVDRARAPVDIAEVVTDVVDEFRPLAADAGVRITSTIGECDIDGNETLIRHLVSNLVQNAIRHNLAADGFAEISTSTLPDGGVELTVANSGPQIPDALLATLTEPFVRGAGRVTSTPDARAPGSGLGLAIVERIATAHDASLELRARDEGGLAVVVRFPTPATS
jgi:two-component system sensor histidine kinase VanS